MMSLLCSGLFKINEKELESNSVLKVSDAFSGTKRSKMGIESAMQNNIEMFMKEIADVEFE
jgi:formiminotetrahydrofolate cyclodeaminase